MNMQRGFRDKLDKYANLNQEIVIEMKVNGSSVYDYCCFGVDGNNKLSDDRYMVFYNQMKSPSNEITYTAEGNGAIFALQLNRLPASINKLVFTVSIDGNGTMGNIMSHTVYLKQNQNVFADMTLSGSDFHSEKAIISIEIYKKDVWRIAAVASGFNGGLSELLREYGGEEAGPSTSGNNPQQSGYNPQQPGYNQQQPGYNQQRPGYNPQQPGYNPQQPGYNPQQPGYNQQQPGYNQQQPGYNQQQPGYNQQQPGYNPQRPVNNPQPQGYNPPPAYNLNQGFHPQAYQNTNVQNPPQKVNLQKGQKVSLVKGNNGLGEILINLNWKQPSGLFSHPIDLDLGCLYELKDGSKGTVQALGNSFGSLTSEPYISLDGDDRTGASSVGENLRINGKMVPKIKRILVYTFIYEGATNWKTADGVVTVKCPGSPDIIVHMDEYGSSQRMCAIAMLENINDTLSVEKVIRFFDGHRYMDQAFNWGLKWVRGSK